MNYIIEHGCEFHVIVALLTYMPNVVVHKMLGTYVQGILLGCLECFLDWVSNDIAYNFPKLSK
jgi:hypothetical protein